ncbi:MAG: WD40 repeat domain-containing protein [Gemmatales bacterium]|nr:WD40 repeat domain-containing protein [Gemmatales bacterium]
MNPTKPHAVLCVLVALINANWVAPKSEPMAQRLFDGHRDNVYSIAASPDGRWIASASEDLTACVWDWKTGRLVARLEHDGPVYEATFSPDGRWLATADGNAKVHLFDAAKFQRVRTLEGHTGPVYALAFSPSSRWLATGGGEKDYVCRVWDVATGKCVQTLRRHQDAIYGVAFASDSVLATSSADKTVCLWDWQRGDARVLQGHTSYVYRCRFSPDGQYLATASHDRTVRVWEWATGKLLRTIQPSKQPVYAVSFSPNARWLACVGEEHAVRIYAWKSEQMPKVISDTRDVVYAVAWLQLDGQEYLTYGGGESKVRVVPVASPTE